MKQRLHFVTSNKIKIAEAQFILDFPIHIHPLDLTEIQSSDLEEIIKKKAEDAYSIIKEPVIVDDTGLFVESWNGFPGPFIKYLIKSGGAELLVKLIETTPNKKASITSAIGYTDGGDTKIFLGKVTGVIATDRKTKSDDIFDVVFIPDGSDKTFSEMSIEEKAKLSHRRRSLDKFKQFVKDNSLKFS